MGVSSPPMLRSSVFSGPLGGSFGAADLTDPAFAATIDQIVKAIQKKDTGKAAGLITTATLAYGPAIIEVGQELFSIRSDSLEALEKKRAQYQYKVATTTGNTRTKYKYKLAAVERQIVALQGSQAAALATLEAGSSAELTDYRPPDQGLPSWLPLALGGGLILVLGVVVLQRSKGE